MVGSEIDTENTYKRYGLILSLILHSLLLGFIVLWPSFRYDTPKPGKEGILIVFGDVLESLGDDEKKSVSKKSDSESKEEKKNDNSTKSSKSTKEVKQKKDKIKEIKFEKNLDENNDNLVLSSDAEKKELKKEIVPEKSISQAKNEFGKLFTSRGTKNSKKGVQGDPLGSRDAKILEGISRGKGEVGEGLDSRGILYEPNFDDSSQKSGRVVVKVCINNMGKVISSKFTQRGSSTTDLELITIAEKNAKKYRFTPSNKERQCGTITIDFIVK